MALKLDILATALARCNRACQVGLRRRAATSARLAQGSYRGLALTLFWHKCLGATLG